MNIRTFTAEALLGPLNEVERKLAPKCLFVAGDTGLFERGPRVSVVGSRKATRGGLELAAQVAGRLAKLGVVVVSGMAEGVDAAAHEAALAIGTRTLAVLGTPLDQAYPTRNAALQARIIREHLAISQFEVGSKVFPGNFPARSRTMALVSDATIIVEAGEKSGTVHQGWEAIRLGRPLLLMERVTSDPKLSWPEEMMRYGAEAASLESLDTLVELLPQRTDVEASALPF
ncbi:MAG: DNA-processing protein DprA [Candidatus Eisenbacteria bacterium]|nr:DNA-processing protein DprA [Candidatus Eisenbacteria bacterium]